ncbi:C-type mannose receptor 2-like [Notolabrus celidotus]|uniref:C-type mannose receptor 2-like n=1 Tax=Notolabrus celidotus TaxID=1203425 RepID=UPI00148F837A|nr:C-type mannose receptor 2-like [Notolabrus celidotus]
MKTAIMFLLVCAVMALTNAAAVPEAEPAEMPEGPSIQEAVQGAEADEMPEGPSIQEPFPEAEADEMAGGPSTNESQSRIAQRSSQCPSGWSHNNGRCFRYISTPQSWAWAEIRCQALGGNLASVHSHAEYLFIQRMIVRATREYPLTWLGGSDAEQEGVWLWSDGSHFTYANWCQWEPNNRGGQQCLRMNWANGKCWDDYQCWPRHPYVCARRARYLDYSVPEAEPDHMTGEAAFEEAFPEAEPGEEMTEEALLQEAFPEAELEEEMTEEALLQEDDGLVRSGGCPSGWTRYETRCFRFYVSQLAWAIAERNCRTRGGNLASVHSYAEYNFIKGLISRRGRKQYKRRLLNPCITFSIGIHSAIKMKSVFLLVCTFMILTYAAAVQGAEADEMAGGPSTNESQSRIAKRSSQCPSVWSHNNGRCFRYISTPQTWAWAEKSCQALGGNLASVHSHAEYVFIQGMIVRATNGYPNTWIGGSDAQQNGVWLWNDGSLFAYANWCQWEPNNSQASQGVQHCLRMNFGDGKCWDDYWCLSRHPYVCARRA